MENRLSDMTCEVCRVGAPPASPEEITRFLAELPDWNIAPRDGIPAIERVFPFKNFAQALAFTNAVGRLAESEGHHPAILTEWGKVTVTYWTHKIRNLHQTDFIMAAKTDRLLSAGAPAASRH